MRRKKEEGREDGRNIYEGFAKMLNHSGDRPRGANIESKAHWYEAPWAWRSFSAKLPDPVVGLPRCKTRQQTRRIARGSSVAEGGKIATARMAGKTAAARIKSNRYPHTHHRSCASSHKTTPLIHHTHVSKQQRRCVLSPARPTRVMYIL